MGINHMFKLVPLDHHKSRIPAGYPECKLEYSIAQWVLYTIKLINDIIHNVLGNVLHDYK